MRVDTVSNWVRLARAYRGCLAYRRSLVAAHDLH